MGGPNHLGEVEIFLKNMFLDPYILPIKSNFLRKIVGNIIVKKRIETAKDIYRSIGGKSPMVELTFSLVKKLQKKDPNRFYSYAMRYTPPYVDLALEEMKQKGIQKIYLFSMYPQYSSATTLSSFSDVYRALKQMDYQPVVEIIDRYYDKPDYHHMMINSILRMLGDQKSDDYVLIFSAHSLPESFVKNGDPYQKECEECLELVKKELEKREIYFKDIILSYQSKLGPVKWIGPSTKSVIQSSNYKKIIVCPFGFTIDNSETIYEINIEYRKLASDRGIRDFIFCPCGNDSDDFVDFILSLIDLK